MIAEVSTPSLIEQTLETKDFGQPKVDLEEGERGVRESVIITDIGLREAPRRQSLIIPTGHLRNVMPSFSGSQTQLPMRLD